ncbi:hypothetical protein SLOPH_900 [Spraguea lophii 42_110]|uniref:Uncharacterized protein n=1 Tax=Spraguea lophii (strain 42_110) TaxID=1358809 RepID=S7W876_SPRLO|nr:hypothetical protein SLOPH_900 [Spraguea lophii 42_110]
MKLHVYSVLYFIIRIRTYTYLNNLECGDLSTYLDTALRPEMIPLPPDIPTYNYSSSPPPSTIQPVNNPQYQYYKYPSQYVPSPVITPSIPVVNNKPPVNSSLTDISKLAGSLSGLISYYTPPKCKSTNSCINFGNAQVPGNNVYINPCTNIKDVNGYKSCIGNSITSLKSNIDKCRKVLGEVDACCGHDKCLEMLKSPKPKPMQIDDATIKKISDSIVNNGIIDNLLARLKQLIEQEKRNKLLAGKPVRSQQPINCSKNYQQRNTSQQNNRNTSK